jgi:hypothetical protein
MLGFLTPCHPMPAVACPMLGTWKAMLCSQSVLRSAVSRALKLAFRQCVPVRCIARWERATSSSRWRKASPARPPKPTSPLPAESFQRAVCVEHFDGSAGPWVDVEERLMRCALLHAQGHRTVSYGRKPYRARPSIDHQDGSARSRLDRAQRGRVGSAID